MQQLRGRTVAAWIGFGLVAVTIALGVSRDDWSDGAAYALRAVLVVGAVIVAGISYQTFSMNPPRTPRVIAAVAASLLGGACLASAATTADDGAVLVDGPIVWVGAVAVLLACVVHHLEALDRGR